MGGVSPKIHQWMFKQKAFWKHKSRSRSGFCAYKMLFLLLHRSLIIIILPLYLRPLMKKLIPLLFIIILLGSCKKTAEKIGEDLVVKAMTDGQWKITKFTQNSTDITSNFSGYKFQYYSNKTVDAILNGVKDRSGNWGWKCFSNDYLGRFSRVASTNLTNKRNLEYYRQRVDICRGKADQRDRGKDLTIR
jgi:hypothetical protein